MRNKDPDDERKMNEIPITSILGDSRPGEQWSMRLLIVTN